MSGKMPQAPAREHRRNLTYIRSKFVSLVCQGNSQFSRHEIEKSSSIREFADLLIIKNRFMSSCFPEVSTAFLIFVIIPVTTVSSERSFSKLKLIKTYWRNSMGQERLRNLLFYSLNIPWPEIWTLMFSLTLLLKPEKRKFNN